MSVRRTVCPTTCSVKKASISLIGQGYPSGWERKLALNNLVAYWSFFAMAHQASASALQRNLHSGVAL